MAEDESKKEEERLEFDSAGRSLGYIHARPDAWPNSHPHPAGLNPDAYAHTDTCPHTDASAVDHCRNDHLCFDRRR